MREFLGFRRVWGALIVPLLFTAACDDDDRIEGAGSGGTSSSGGEPSTGGADASGGASSGGTSGSGGTASGGGKASGGVSGSGGTASGGAASGGAASGGAASGGAASGGTSSGGAASGGTSSGGAASGGTSGSGGAPLDSGADAAPDAPFDAGPEGGDAATPIITVSLDKTRVPLRAGNSVTFVATVSGDPNNAGVDWTVTGGGAIDAAGVYTAAANAASGVAVVTARARADATESASAQVLVVQPGTVTSSGHPLVAAYAITPPEAATVRVQFGTDVAYEKETSEVPATAGASSSRFVAGMPAATLHHLRAVLTFGDGLEYLDADHSFTTGALPAGMPVLTSTIETGKTPTPGIEIINSTSRLVTASDLAGNIVWYYEHPAETVPTSVGSVNLLPNGNFVSIIAPSSTLPLSPSVGTYLNVVREYDLAGNTVRELTGDQLNTRLSQAATSGCTECDFTNQILHHEVIPLPNGHFLVLGNTVQTCGASTGCTGDPAEVVLGDVIIDLDQNLNPVWAWNAFNHVPVDRSAFLFPDWTQSNSLAYSPADGSLLLSSRHLSWILKIAYANGTGNGNVIWRLGLGGDFTLQGGEEPHDWFNAQHTPSFTTSVTTGTFPLMVFDNGTYRQFSPSNPCGTVALPCSYSTVPTFEINETAKTATLVSNLRSPIYSRAGGNAEVLPGGNVHFTAAAAAQDESDVYEYTGGQAPALVMHLNIKGQNAYRSHRRGSLYPNITW